MLAAYAALVGAEQAVRAVPDLVLLDVAMPTMDELEAAKGPSSVTPRD